jgi:hypothetical protein
MIEKVIQFFKTTAGKIALIAFLLGVMFGWFVIGWNIWPVTWVDAGYVDLQEDFRTMTMENDIYAYAQTGDDVSAIQSYMAFGSTAAGTLADVKANQTIDPVALAKFETLLQANGNMPIGEIPEAGDGETGEMEEVVSDEPEVITTDPDQEAEQVVPENKALSRIGTFLGVLFILFLIIGGALIYMFIIPLDTKRKIQGMFKRGERQGETSGNSSGEETPAYLATMGNNADYSFSVDVESASYQDSTPVTPPVNAQQQPHRSAIERTVNYVHNDAGHSHLDQNFSLKDTDDSGKTVLEYGVAMSDYVEIAGVTYALAFDVYLASHPERRTITRVLVNKELLSHPEVLQRYEGKGEPIKIDEFHTFQLATTQYRLNGTIVAANYVYDENYGGNYLREMEVDMLIHYL